MMEKVINNLKPGFAIVEDELGVAYAYDPEKFSLLPKTEKEVDVSLYPMDANGTINYDSEVKLSNKLLKPKWVRMAGIDLVNF